MIHPSPADALWTRDQLAHACETMVQLLHSLLERKTKVAPQIHAIRKLGKSLRGGLAAFGLKDDAARCAQAVNRLFSSLRDATSRSNTWRKLGWQDDSNTAIAIQQLLDQLTRSAARRPPPEIINWCVQRIASARMQLLEKPAGELAPVLTKGLQEVQRRAYKRCHAMNHRGQKEFHVARKAVKAWLGASSYLPAGLLEMDPGLEPLARLLGDENDLAILAGWLKGHGFSRRIAPGLWQSLKSAQRKIHDKVLRQAAVLQAPASC